MIFAYKKIEMNKNGKVVFIGKIICTYYKNGICSAPWTIENCPLKAYKCKLKK